MRINRALMYCAAAALIGAGCEVHERDREPVGVGVSADVAVDEPQGEVVQGPGVEAIDVEPDPAQRVYVYDEGYPPGTYVYDNYYYYGGYRYPRDIFVNRYVQENVRQHRFVNKEENHRQAMQIQQRHRTEFAQTHGKRQNRPEQRTVPERNIQTPGHQPETPRPNVERPENRTPAVQEHHPAVERPENRATPNETRTPAQEHHPAVERPENRATPNETRTPAQEHRPVERPENRATPNETRTPAQEHRPNVTPENKRENEKREESK